MNAPAQPVPQATPNGYPSMKVVRALAAASKRVAEVTCNGKSGDPRDPYAYARADDLVAAAKDAIHSEGLLVLPASSDEKPEAVGNGAVIWLRQTFNVVHVESGEWLPFQADPWPLQQNKPIDKAMATAKTASKAYFYLSLLEIRRVGPNAEDMDADLPPLSEQTANRSDKPAERSDKPITDSTQIGISAKAKRGGSAAHIAMKREAENRQKVDPEENAAELAKFAATNFPTEGDPEMAPTPAPADDTTNRTQESPPTRTEDLIHPASGTSSEAGTLNSTEALTGSVLPVSDGQPVSAAGPGPRSGPNSGPNFLDQGEWAGVKSESSAGGESLPPSSSSPPAPGPFVPTPRIQPRDPRVDPASGDEVCFGRHGIDVAIVQGVAELEGKGPMVEFVLACDEDERSHFQSLSGWRFLFTEDDADGTLGGVVQHVAPPVEPDHVAPDGTMLASADLPNLAEPWEDEPPSRGRPVGKAPPPVLAKRSAEGRAAKWATAKLTKARKAFGCDVCQPKDETGDRPGVLLDKFAIQPKAQYRDGQAGKACIPCWERLESEAAGAGKESAA